MATHEEGKPLRIAGSRIFTPLEIERIQRVITKPSLLALFNLLLFTGMRLSEVAQIAKEPGRFDPVRKCIEINSTKAKAKDAVRKVRLNDQGVEAVKEYLKNPYVPSCSSVWQSNLIRWSRQAHLTEFEKYDSSSNPYDVTVRSTRKTWECWLCACFEERLPTITKSMGHTAPVALKHYIDFNFTDEEIERIYKYTKGWNGKKLNFDKLEETD